jgi:hypothetical protein
LFVGDLSADPVDVRCKQGHIGRDVGQLTLNNLGLDLRIAFNLVESPI